MSWSPQLRRAPSMRTGRPPSLAPERLARRSLRLRGLYNRRPICERRAAPRDELAGDLADAVSLEQRGELEPCGARVPGHVHRAAAGEGVYRVAAEEVGAV